MSNATPSPRLGPLRTLAFTMAVAALTVAAAGMMFSAFMFYDDEGYVLMSLRNFAEHGRLYDAVYSQYGPFPFVSYYLLNLTGIPLTHFVGRIVTLLAWTGCAVCCASIVYRSTRHFLLTLLTLAAVYPYLWVMVSEPSHPGGLIAIGVALAAVLGHAAILNQKPQRWAWSAGGIAAALALTKINVGGFLVLSGLAWIIIHHESDRVRARAPWLLAFGAVLVPLALMRPMLSLAWVQTLAIVFACAGVAGSLALADETAPRTNWKTLGACALSAAGVSGLIIGIVLLRGSTLFDILEGTLLGPIRHPAAFNLSYTWPAGASAFAAISLLLCGAAVVWRRRGSERIHTIIALARLAASAGVMVAVLQFPAASPDRLVFSFGAPCLWLFLWALPGIDATTTSAQRWVALLWLGQYLHTFPVAGSQIAWGTFLLIPLAALGGYDAATWLAARHRLQLGAVTQRGRPILFATLAVLIGIVGVRFAKAGGRYREGSDLALNGAEFLRLPTQSTALFRLLALNATAHADVLFSEPGMFSLNLWSGVAPPTLANVTHWFSLLSPARQQAIIEKLAQHPRAVVIIQRDHINFLTKRSFAPAGPLHDYIAQHFAPAFVLDDFEFHVRRGRRIAPLNLGEMLVMNDERGRENTALKVRLLLPAGHPIARIELSAPHAPQNPPLRFEAKNARVEVTPTDLRGATAGPTRTANWPLQVYGSATLLIHFDRFTQPQPVAAGLITLFGPDGSEVGLARLGQ